MAPIKWSPAFPYKFSVLEGRVIYHGDAYKRLLSLGKLLDEESVEILVYSLKRCTRLDVEAEA